MKEKGTFLTESLPGGLSSETRNRRNIGLGRALILTSDEKVSASLPGLVQQCGLEPVSLGTMADLRSCRLNCRISLLLCEQHLPDGTFRDVLDFLQRMAQDIPVIVFSRLAEWEDYIEAMRRGAYDCLRYPFRTGELQWIISRMLHQTFVEFSPGQSRKLSR